MRLGISSRKCILHSKICVGTTARKAGKSRGLLPDMRAILQIYVSIVANIYRFYIIYRICNGIRSNWGSRWRSWLRYYATNRKVAGSIPDGVVGIFH